MKNPSQPLKFTRACMQLAGHLQLPLSQTYFHAFMVALYCLKIKLGVTYRQLNRLAQ